MRRFSPSIRPWLLPAILLLAVVPVLQAAQDQSADAPSSPPSIGTSLVAGKPAFCSSRTVLWAGRTAVIPLRTEQAANTDQTYTLNTSETGVLEVLKPPTVLSGETRGYLRVRALRAGKVRLGLRGDATLDVEVRPDPVGAAFARVDAESPRPRIVSPVPDAVVWGRFSVGVDVFDGNGASDEPKVQLRLPNGQLLEPTAHTGPESGPTRHYQFEVSADDLSAGPAKLVATSSPAGFTDVDRLAKKPGSLLESEPVALRVQRPNADALLAGHCADPAIMGSTRDLFAPRVPRVSAPACLASRTTRRRPAGRWLRAQAATRPGVCRSTPGRRASISSLSGRAASWAARRFRRSGSSWITLKLPWAPFG